MKTYVAAQTQKDAQVTADIVSINSGLAPEREVTPKNERRAPDASALPVNLARLIDAVGGNDSLLNAHLHGSRQQRRAVTKFLKRQGFLNGQSKTLALPSPSDAGAALSAFEQKLSNKGETL